MITETTSPAAAISIEISLSTIASMLGGRLSRTRRTWIVRSAGFRSSGESRQLIAKVTRYSGVSGCPTAVPGKARIAGGAVKVDRGGLVARIVAMTNL